MHANSSYENNSRKKWRARTKMVPCTGTNVPLDLTRAGVVGEHGEVRFEHVGGEDGVLIDVVVVDMRQTPVRLTQREPYAATFWSDNGKTTELELTFVRADSADDSTNVKLSDILLTFVLDDEVERFAVLRCPHAQDLRTSVYLSRPSRLSRVRASVSGDGRAMHWTSSAGRLGVGRCAELAQELTYELSPSSKSRSSSASNDVIHKDPANQPERAPSTLSAE